MTGNRWAAGSALAALLSLALALTGSWTAAIMGAGGALILAVRAHIEWQREEDW